ANGGPLALRLIAGSLAGAPSGAGASASGIELAWGSDGPRGLDENYILDRMSAALDRPLNVIELERQFRLLTDDPAIATLAADLQPGTRPGEARLALTAFPAERFSLFAGFANSRSPAIGGERYSIGGAVRNLISPGDLVSAEGGLTAGEYDWNLGYEAPILSDKLRMRLRGGENRAAVVDGQLQPLNITAADWQVEGALIWRALSEPLTPGSSAGVGRPARSLDLGLGAIHREARTTLLGEPFSFTPGAVDGKARYTALRLTADFITRSVNTVFAASLTATQGLDGSRSDLPGLISPDRDFQAYRAQLSFARRLNQSGLELRLRTSGQWASGILYAGERFAVGGARTVRGYRETLSLADTGLLGSVELAQSFSLSKRADARSRFDPLRFSASVFADGAITGNREGPRALPDELASVGVGLAWQPSPAIDARLVYGEALIDVPIIGERDLQDRGFSFRIQIRPLEWFAS
ncbi:MAG: ShlB/FhaC/HecB family hemolysin secretion/activation protein, partial [Pseudomonadota bacterium]